MKKILMAAAFAIAAATTAQNAWAQTAANTQTATNEQADLDAKYATDLLKKGADAPDITLKTIDGKTFKLSDMRGRYVVIDFWASWCPDCRRDAPEIVKMHKAFKGNGVEFVGVSFDTKAESWKNGVDKLGMEYTQASELKNMRESAVAQAYHIKWIPTVYVIDPHGKIVFGTVMSAKVNDFLTKLFPDNDE